MKLTIPYFILVMLITFSPSLLGEGATDKERLLLEVPGGWVKIDSQSDEHVQSAYYLREGVDADDAKEILAAQIIFGRADRKPEAILGVLADEADKQCDPFHAAAIPLEDVNPEYATLAIMVLCGWNKAAQTGEVTLVRAITGKQNLYLIQKIWKTLQYNLDDEVPVSFDERKTWREFLFSVDICQLDSNNCPAGTE